MEVKNETTIYSVLFVFAAIFLSLNLGNISFAIEVHDLGGKSEEKQSGDDSSEKNTEFLNLEKDSEENLSEEESKSFASKSVVPSPMSQPISFSGSKLDPRPVWIEDFDHPPVQDWTNQNLLGNNPNFANSTARLVNYVGVTPSDGKSILQSTWGDVRNCVGIRVSYDSNKGSLPNEALVISNNSYCGSISYAGLNSSREEW